MSVFREGDSFLWEVGSWRKIEEVPTGPAVEHCAVLFSRSGIVFFVAQGVAWDSVRHAVLRRPRTETWGGNWGDISPDGKLAVATDGGGAVTFVDIEHGKVVGYHRAHQDNGRAVAFSPDGKLVATGGEDIILWDAASQEKLLHFEHSAVVWSVAFSPDGRWLVSSHGDGSILVWDVKEREHAASLEEHSGPVRAVAFSSDGKFIASASEDRSVIVWNAASRRKEITFTGLASRVTGVAFLPGHDGVAASSFAGTVTLFDISNGEARWKNGPGPYDYPIPYCLAASPDGRWIATGQGIYASDDGHRVIGFGNAIYDQSMYGAAFSPDSRRFVCSSSHGFLTLWRTDDWNVIAVEPCTAQLVSVSFSSDGKWLATGEDEGSVRLWEAEPLRQVAVIGKHAVRVKSVVFSPDGRHIASAGDDQTVSLWDVKERRLISNIGSHTAPVLSLAFSPDGKRLVTREHDKSVRIYTRHRKLWGYQLD